MRIPAIVVGTERCCQSASWRGRLALPISAAEKVLPISSATNARRFSRWASDSCYVRSVPPDVVIPARITSIDVGAAYRGVRDRVVELTSGLSAEGWEQVVPHCPNWTVRQTIAHLSGIVDDALNDNMVGVATDPWTAAQIAERADTPGPAIIEEWTTYAPFVDARATELGLSLAQLLFDAVNHEHDLRHALKSPGRRDSDALWVAAHFVSVNINSRFDANGLEPITLIVDDEALTGRHAIALHGSVFDVVRAACSRRSLAQIRSMHWVGDPSAHIDKLFPFTPPPHDIEE